ncbi:MAG: site-specific DNA-methyltransferase [Candidatus Limnocylindrales bacterium]
MTIEHDAIDDLRPDAANPRRISDAELEALTRSVREWGFVQPVLVRRADRTVIGGHQRLLAARKLGIKTVPVIFLDLAVEQARLLNLALNRISGTWDTELLARLLADLQPVDGIDLSLTGFDEGELDKLLKSLDLRERREKTESFDVEAALEAARSATRAKRGELWALGDHRLLVADSTDVGAVTRLFDGKQAALLATDPPYLVDYQGGNHPASNANKGRKSKDKHWDDYHDPEAAVAFYAGFLKAALPHLRPEAPVYQWHATRRQALVEQAWREAGLLVHQTIIWAKERAVLTHSHYMWGHEPCFYGWVEGQQPKRKPPADTSTVWRIASESLGVHPTQKPLEIFERPISYHTQPGDVCYEPFAGSGTQFIAAERLGRVCYGLELDAHFATVILARYEAFSGKEAVCLGSS